MESNDLENDQVRSLHLVFVLAIGLLLLFFIVNEILECMYRMMMNQLRKR